MKKIEELDRKNSEQLLKEYDQRDEKEHEL